MAAALCASAGLLAASVEIVRSLQVAATQRMAPFVASVSTISQGGIQPAFPVIIRRPEGPPVIELQTRDPLGRASVVGCSTCHSVREPNFANRAPSDLDRFHQGMQFLHGSLTCFSCHNPNDYDALRLADGTVVDYPNVMTLCAQCHGPQATGFAHGAHGGMNGYWDLTRGPRTRNNCIDCHDPHVPKFPQMQTTFKPRDRFLEPPESHAARNLNESH